MDKERWNRSKKQRNNRKNIETEKKDMKRFMIKK